MNLAKSESLRCNGKEFGSTWTGLFFLYHLLSSFLSIHPRLEHLLPKFLSKELQATRKSMFVVLANDDHHFDRYLDYYKSREDNIDFLKYNGDFLSISRNFAPVGQYYRFVAPTSSYGLYNKHNMSA